MMVDPQIALAAGIFLGSLLIAAAIHKLLDPQRFRKAIASYRLAPRPFLRPAVTLIPVAELLLGLTLFWPATRQLAARIAIMVFFGYGLAITVTMLRGADLTNCGCSFTAGPVARSWFPIMRNAVLCLIAGLIVSPPVLRAMTALDIVQAMLAAASLATLYIAAEALDSAGLWEKR